jgi:hypothetical protein
VIWTIIRHRRTMRARPELKKAYRAEREELRAARRRLRDSELQLPRAEQKDLAADLDRAVKDARRELVRALREAGHYHPIDDRPPRTLYAQAILEINAERSAAGDPALAPGPGRAAHLIGVADPPEAVPAS